jgi:hypothetical protein
VSSKAGRPAGKLVTASSAMKCPASGLDLNACIEASGELIRGCRRNKRIGFGTNYGPLQDAPCHAFDVHTCCGVPVQFQQRVQRLNEAGYQDTPRVAIAREGLPERAAR